MNIEFPCMQVTINDHSHLDDSFFNTAKQVYPRLHDMLKEKGFAIVFESIEDVKDAMASDEGIESKSFKDERSMFEYLCELDDEFFIISRKNWTPSNIAAIAKLYDESVVEAMMEEAKRAGWPVFQIN